MKNRRDIMRIVLSAAVLVSLAFMYACAKAEQDNPYDPKASSYYGNIVCVSIEEGDNTYDGSKERPLKTIQAGILKAKELYIDKGKLGAVLVAEGTYSNIDEPDPKPPVVTMIDGISIYGGYSKSFKARNPSMYPTIIEDTRNSGGADWEDPNRAVDCNTTISSGTVIDGFTIKGGGGVNAAAIFCNLGCSPTISNNKIYGGSEGNGNTYGILSVSSSPVIKKNDLYGGDGDAASEFSAGVQFAKSTQPSPPVNSPILSYNRIDGGAGFDSYGIFDSETESSCIYNNTIFGGTGNRNTYALYIFDSSPKVYNNTLDGGYPATVTGSVNCIYIFGFTSSSPFIDNNIMVVERLTLSIIENGIFEFNATSTPASLKNNDFYNCRNALYRDHDGTLITNIANVNAFAFAQGNVNLDPVFQLPISVSISWFQADHRLTSGSPVNITQGGIDGNLSGWPFSDDLNEISRTNLTEGPNDNPTNTGAAGWSIGAYEYY